MTSRTGIIYIPDTVYIVNANSLNNFKYLIYSYLHDCRFTFVRNCIANARYNVLIRYKGCAFTGSGLFNHNHNHMHVPANPSSFFKRFATPRPPVRHTHFKIRVLRYC